MPYYDAALSFRGAVQFDETGDFLLVQGTDLMNQRIARRLYTNPMIATSDSEILFPGDDPFNQNYGIGLGRRIDAVLESRDFSDIVADTKRGVGEEELVDQAVGVKVDFLHNRVLGAELMKLAYTMRDGTYGQVGFKL